jgi:C1A family cysteine protease
MRVFGIFAFVAAVASATTDRLIDQFRNWVETFEIQIKDQTNFGSLFSVWSDNHKFIEEVNAKNLSYTLGHNAYSGMTAAEYREFFHLGEISVSSRKEISATTTSHRRKLWNAPSLRGVLYLFELPNEVDWVKRGAVSQVKDQGQCGSCWSFSTTGALEGAYFLKEGTLVSFSEQQLVDCDFIRYGGYDLGCNGGIMDRALEWIGENGGLCTEAAYPYVSGTTLKHGVCEKTCSVVAGSSVQSIVDVLPWSDVAMMTALAQNPVAIAIEADQREFQLYKSGVFTGSCGTTLDHGVLAVGYGTAVDGTDYYLVKNSWGTSWGESGFIRLARGDEYNSGAGQCGMLLEGSFPVV